MTNTYLEILSQVAQEKGNENLSWFIKLVLEEPHLELLQEAADRYANQNTEPIAKHRFHLGNVEVNTNNINELREYVQELSDKLDGGSEYGKYLSDFIFDVEAEYQRFHNLEPDDWSVVHGEK